LRDCRLKARLLSHTGEEAWRVFLADRTEADFDEYRKHRAWTAWKYAMCDSGCKLPTQLASGRSRCFCGTVIDIKGMSQHVHVAHMERIWLQSRDRKTIRDLLGYRAAD
jgi:hypothetical protein